MDGERRVEVLTYWMVSGGLRYLKPPSGGRLQEVTNCKNMEGISPRYWRILSELEVGGSRSPAQEGDRAW